jgi:NADH:ubiquinone oxidoreductase subunit 3 (subunit A)
MRVMAYIAFAAVIGIATGLVLHRVIVGVLVGAGVLLLGLVILINRAGPSGTEPYETGRRGRPDSGEP